MAGVRVHLIGGDRLAVLVVPDPPVQGPTPLILSLHCYQSGTGQHDAYVPLTECVNRDGLALILPNGTKDQEGRQRLCSRTEKLSGRRSMEHL